MTGSLNASSAPCDIFGIIETITAETPDLAYLSQIEVTLNKTTVSLVLGSGSAKGLAHIGVINWLNHNGYDIRSVAGSSMGALVGGIYACGELDTYSQWVLALEKMDIIRLLDFSFSSKGLFKGERVINVLKELIGERNIEDLPISYTAVATDLDRGKEIWLNSGSLFEAIRASIAIPTLLTPHHYLGKHMLDGGLVNPIPIAPTLSDKTDITVAVNLRGKSASKLDPPGKSPMHHGAMENNYRKKILQFINGLQKALDRESKEEIDLFRVLDKSMDTMQTTLTRFQLAAYSPDFVIEIPRNACNFYEFHRAEYLIGLGWQKADEHMRTAKGSRHN